MFWRYSYEFMLNMHLITYIFKYLNSSSKNFNLIWNQKKLNSSKDCRLIIQFY